LLCTLFYLASIVAYVQSVSPVKTAKKSPHTKYYNMIFQSEKESYRGVSYNEDMRETLVKAETEKS